MLSPILEANLGVCMCVAEADTFALRGPDFRAAHTGALPAESGGLVRVCMIVAQVDPRASLTRFDFDIRASRVIGQHVDRGGARHVLAPPQRQHLDLPCGGSVGDALCLAGVSMVPLRLRVRVEFADRCLG